MRYQGITARHAADEVRSPRRQRLVDLPAGTVVDQDALAAMEVGARREGQRPTQVQLEVRRGTLLRTGDVPECADVGGQGRFRAALVPAGPRHQAPTVRLQVEGQLDEDTERASDGVAAGATGGQ